MDRVSRGSIRSRPLASAVRKGEVSRRSPSSISARFASGSGASAMTRRKAASVPPSMCIDPQRPETQA